MSKHYSNSDDLGLRNKLKCECGKIISMYQVAPAGCADDNAAVAALPDAWVPRHSGPILANYLKKREQDHEKILQDITDSAKLVNDKMHSKIRVLSEALLAHIQYNNNQYRCLLQNYNSGTVLEKELRDNAFKEMYQLYSDRMEQVAHFKGEATALERERAADLRIVLRDQFQRLIKVGHQTPRDLLHDFDERVYQINQQLMSNNRAYIDLEAQLRVQADEDVGRARSAINQLCLSSSMRDRAQSAVPRDSQLQPDIQRPASALDEKKSEITLLSFDSTSKDVEAIEACVSRLVQAYKEGVMQVFKGFSVRLVDLERDLGTNHYFPSLCSHSCQAVEFHDIIEKTACRLSSSLHTKHIASRNFFETTGTDMLAIQKSLRSLGVCLQNTFDMLHDAGHLWDNHILRQALAQKLTIAAVEDLLTSNDTIEMSNEVTFNIALEQLRGSSDPDKLQVEYGYVLGMLDKIAEMYRIHSEAELGRLEEFMKLPTSLANTLLSEFQCFLEKYPQPGRNSHPLGTDAPPPHHEPCSTPRAPSECLLSPLPRAMLQTELQELALSNWRNGFLESFECNVSSVPEELRRQARFWVEERASALHMRFSLKMVSHRIRVERVKVAYETRLSELRHHEARLGSHLDALNQLIQNLPLEVSKFPSETTSLYPLKDWINRIQENIDALMLTDEPPNPETKRLKMCSYAPRLLKHRKLYEESINDAIDDYKRLLENRVQNARISSVRLLYHIKLFNEGGEYSALEATKACVALVKGTDALDSCATKLVDALNNRRNVLLTQADQLLQPLQKICDETLGTGKGGKAPASQKKKK